MTDERLLVHRQVAKRAPQFRRRETGIVPEAARSRWRLGDPPRGFAARNVLAVLFAPAVRGRAHVPRRPVLNAGESRQQQAIVLVVERLPRQIRPPAPAFAQHARRTIQRLDLKTGIVRERWHSGQVREISRLCECVFFERGSGLDVALARGFRNASAAQIDDFMTSGTDQGTQLTDLPGTAGGEQQSNGQAPSARRCASSSSLMPFVARSSSASTSPRANVPCSPVPCTSTNRPSLLMTTFMSTSATTSSE